MRTELLPIEKIRADRRAQPRVEVDQFLVDEYADAMLRGERFPPVVVFFDDDVFWLADGFHRHLAAIQAKVAMIEADVHEGGLRDAILHSVGANAGHGLRRTNADKRRAVTTLFQDLVWREWSDGRIASQCAVSDRFVAKVRGELSPNGSEIARRVERQGQTYTMATARIGSARKLAKEARNLLRDTDVADDRRQVARLAERPPEVQVLVAEKIAGGEAKTVHEALKLVRYEGKIATNLREAVTGRFPVVYADPPWRFDAGDGLPGVAGVHYPTMRTEEICVLPVMEKAATNAVLFLWTTNAHLPDAFHVMEAWGFRYVSNIAWVKNTMGVGFYVRGKHELLLLGVRGSMLPKGAPPSVVFADAEGHSVKPERVSAIIDEEMYPDQPGYLELFARRPPARPRWVQWGNEPALAQTSTLPSTGPPPGQEAPR